MVRRACHSQTSYSSCWPRRINHRMRPSDTGSHLTYLIALSKQRLRIHFLHQQYSYKLLYNVIFYSTVLSPFYRFVCCDLDGDSRLAPQEMRHFYKVQLHRVTSLVSQLCNCHGIATQLTLFCPIFCECFLYHTPEFFLSWISTRRAKKASISRMSCAKWWI